MTSVAPSLRCHWVRVEEGLCRAQEMEKSQFVSNIRCMPLIRVPENRCHDKGHIKGFLEYDHRR